MSDEASNWAKISGPRKQPAYGVLRELADHAGNHHGIDVAYACPSIDLLAKESRWSKNAVLESIEYLVECAYLLRRRPSDRGTGRGTGRHSDYVLPLDRDPVDLARRLGWPAPPDDWSARRTDRTTSPCGTDHGDEAGTDAMEEPPSPATAPAKAQAAPTAAVDERGTDPVEGALTPSSERSATGTYRPAIGPRSVHDRSTIGAPGGTELEPELNQPPMADVAHRPAGGSDAPPSVDNPADSWFIQQLRDAIEAGLAALDPPVTAAGTTWDLSPTQLIDLTVHAAAWPTATDAIAAFAVATIELIEHYGVVPHSARAWRAPWLGLTPPGQLPGEPLCSEHTLMGIAVPARVCAQCRQGDVPGAVAQ